MPEPALPLRRLLAFTPPEALVPLLSFGGALTTLLLGFLDADIDPRIPALGCVAASLLLAYLAWMREKKDIVALTTPIYSFIFFIIPADAYSALVLQALFAASLMVLLVRLKHRFGEAGARPVSSAASLQGSLRGYVERAGGQCGPVSAGTARIAERAFMRFARGEYREAYEVAGAGAESAVHEQQAGVLVRAFSVLREQALIHDHSGNLAGTRERFSEGDAAFLARPPRPGLDGEKLSDALLDNALLLLFAVAWNNIPADRDQLVQFMDFAVRLAEE